MDRNLLKPKLPVIVTQSERNVCYLDFVLFAVKTEFFGEKVGKESALYLV